MTYDTIKDGDSTPLQEGGYSIDGTSTSAAPFSTKNKHTSSAIVRAMMVGAAVGVLLLMMAGYSKMMMDSSSNVHDGSQSLTQLPDVSDANSVKCCDDPFNFLCMLYYNLCCPNDDYNYLCFSS